VNFEAMWGVMEFLPHLLSPFCRNLNKEKRGCFKKTTTSVVYRKLSTWIISEVQNTKIEILLMEENEIKKC